MYSIAIVLTLEISPLAHKIASFHNVNRIDMVFNLTLKCLSNICLNFWKKMRQIWEFWSIIYTDFGQLFLLSNLTVPLDVHWSCIIGSTIDATLQFLHGYPKAQPRTPSTTTKASSESVTIIPRLLHLIWLAKYVLTILELDLYEQFQIRERKKKRNFLVKCSCHPCTCITGDFTAWIMKTTAAKCTKMRRANWCFPLSNMQIWFALCALFETFRLSF